MPDRRELDDAVLQLIGVASKRRRDELIAELYAYLREFFERTRQKEEKAIANKKTPRNGFRFGLLIWRTKSWKNSRPGIRRCCAPTARAF
jgi:hypothetical protein